MTYRDRFVAVVQCNGKILREEDEVVTLPFGSEYSLKFKNLDSRKVVVKVSIDGENVSENGIIIQGNSDGYLEGFLEGFVVKNKFKFIKKTQEIVNHRGDRIDDGIIRVEFQHEKKVEHVRVDYEYHPWIIHPHPYKKCFDYYEPYYNGNLTGSASFKSEVSVNSLYCASDILRSSDIKADEGITVKGSESSQRFNYGHVGELEDSSVIIIRLKGTNKGVEVQAPVTVKDKIECPTCGRKHNFGTRYCPNCGTYLV